MPVEAIVRICTTVAAVQLCSNLVANALVFRRNAYQQASERLEQAAKAKQQLQNSNNKDTNKGNSNSSKDPVKGAAKTDKKTKQSQRVDEEHGSALALVTGMHLVPNIATSAVFLLLVKILGTEFQGSVVAVLPFVPFQFLQRLTARSLEFGPEAATAFDGSTTPAAGVTSLGQACSFMFIYVLTTASIKFYINKLFGTPPPPNASGGLNSLLDTPMGQRMSNEYNLKEE